MRSIPRHAMCDEYDPVDPAPCGLCDYYREREEFWTTEGGVEIPYSQLSDDHLDNILAMLRRSEDSSTDLEETMTALEEEQEKRAIGDFDPMAELTGDEYYG